MSRGEEVEPVPPWYRQFWPWFVILLPASAVMASLYTLVLAVRTTDSLVVSGDGGVDVVTERLLRAERHAADLGLGAALFIDAASGVITATLTADREVPRPQSLELRFSHPAFLDRDRSVKLLAALPDAAGSPVWAGHVAAVPEGRWYVVLRSDEWRLSGVWAGASRLDLEASGGNVR